MHRAIIETKTYTLDNKGPELKTVVIDHPYQPDWKLLNEDKPIEITDNYIRFEVKAVGRQTTTFAVREMRESWERIQVSSLTPDHIVVFAGKKYVSQDTRRHLEKIVALKSEIAAIDQDLKSLEKVRDGIFKDQKRLRDNLQGLGQTTEEKDLRSNYVKQLTQQETQMEKQREREKALERQRETKQGELNELIAALEQDLSVHE
jgi:chromosome segregation ATPase